MLKNITYTEKLTIVKVFFSDIIEDIKKDLKMDHLQLNRQFVKTYFTHTNTNKFTVEEMTAAYLNALEKDENIEAIGDFMTHRWLLKNPDLYAFFEEKLTKITPDFTELELLEEADAEELMNFSIQEFGAIKAFIFVVLNSVVFPKNVLDAFKSRALIEKSNRALQQQKSEQNEKARAEERNYELNTARLSDKYEKKIKGLEKKYHTDIAALKKQISNLEQKLQKR